jgi:hypothetical protein
VPLVVPAGSSQAVTQWQVYAHGATPTKCVVPKLGGASLSLAKDVLLLLGCKVGKVKKATSIGVTVSSGKPKPKPKPKKK